MPSTIPSIELLNYNILRHAGYHTYDNWKQILDENFNEVQLYLPENRIQSFTNSSVINPGLYPSGIKRRVLYRPLSFSMNWEIYAYNYPGITKDHILRYENMAYDKKATNSTTNHDSEQQISFITFLQNLNVNLKQHDPEVIVEKIYGFDFLEMLMKEQF